MTEDEAFAAAVAKGAWAGMNPPRLEARISLPFPVSTHKAFRKHKGAHLSEEYRQWRDRAGWELLGQRPAKIKGHVSVLIELVSPDKRRRDTDNFIKGPMDLLVTHGVIEGDDSRFVREVTARWVDAGEPCRVVVSEVRE